MFFQKLNRRKSILDMTTTYTDKDKLDICVGLIADATSPENSETECDEESDNSDEKTTRETWLQKKYRYLSTGMEKRSI